MAHNDNLILDQYLASWTNPIDSQVLALILGYSVSTVENYRNRMERNVSGYFDKLPPRLAKRPGTRTVIYSRQAIFDWWLRVSMPIPSIPVSRTRGRPTKALQFARQLY